MSEHTRMAPSHWPLRRANGAVFVAIPVLHEDRADKVWAQLPGQIAAGQPFAFEVAAYLRTLCVNRAAAADPAIVAQRARRLVEMRDLQRRAAHRAGPAGFSQRRGHHFLLALRPRLTNRSTLTACPYHYSSAGERRIFEFTRGASRPALPGAGVRARRAT